VNKSVVCKVKYKNWAKKYKAINNRCNKCTKHKFIH